MMRAALAIVVAAVLVLAWWATRSETPAPPPIVTTTSAAVASTTTSAAEPAPLVLPAPPFDEYLAPDLEDTPPTRVRLTGATTRRRDVLESDEAWLARHGLTIPEHAAAVASALVPGDVRGVALTTLLRTPPGLLAIYGGRYILVSEPGTTRTLDADAYLHSPHDRPNYMRDTFSDADYADLIAQKTTWAARRGALLYFQNNHETYAADSGHYTAFVSAFDVARGALRWRSRPLIARARNFVVVGDAIVAAYGMTREPDFVYVIDAATGVVVQAVPIPSAPGWLAVQGDRLFVQCYDGEADLRITR